MNFENYYTEASAEYEITTHIKIRTLNKNLMLFQSNSLYWSNH